MSLVAAKARVPLLIAVGGVALVAAAVLVVWKLNADPVAGASNESLVDRLIAAKPDARGPMVIELGQRGPAALPLLKEAYAKASADPELRIQLVNAIFRMAAPEARATLAELAKTEQDPEVQNRIHNNLVDMDRNFLRLGIR